MVVASQGWRVASERHRDASPLTTRHWFSVVPTPVLLGDRSVILLEQFVVAAHEALAAVGVHLHAAHLGQVAPDVAEHIRQRVLVVGGVFGPRQAAAAVLALLLVLAHLAALALVLALALGLFFSL